MSVLSLLINPAGSHTACGLLITPTAPLNRDNLQQKIPILEVRYRRVENLSEVWPISQKRDDFKNIIDNTRKNKKSNSLEVRCVGYKSSSDNEDLKRNIQSTNFLRSSV